ncbi:MAG TPA: flavodoxin family protein [Dehalococcoidia bacterium]|nr:flavodoxin family protein [Dehalococcoidia bacterium]
MKILKRRTIAKEMKGIIALSCGSKNGNCETYIRAAAKGAGEFGVETEIIRATELKVLPCRGCGACSPRGKQAHTGKCVLKDDVEWILQKTVLSDAALIIAAPVFYLRPNGYFMCICERMHPLMFNHTEILKRSKVGAIISHGGSPNDWACLSLASLNIWTQHFIRLVDQVHIGGGEPKDPLSRAEELGRNVARAIAMPIENVNYVGEETPVSCPSCHCDIMQASQDSPHIVCPVCWVHGEISFDNGKMKVKWDEWESQYPRFSELGVFEHMAIGTRGERLRFESSKLRFSQLEGSSRENRMEEMRKRQQEVNKIYSSYGTIIEPSEKN